MFHFPALPPHRLCIHLQVTPHNWCEVSPFGHPRINALLTTPRGLTQSHTSFIGSACQGIHHTPVEKTQQAKNTKTKIEQTKKKKDARVHYTVLTQHTPTTTGTHKRCRDRRSRTRHTNLCCPRHPTAHQHTPKTGSLVSVHIFVLEVHALYMRGISSPRAWCASTRISKQTVAAARSTTQPPTHKYCGPPATAGRKIKAP